jgi:intracellular septation protein
MQNSQHSWVKLAVEIGPLIVFFTAYKFGGLMASTAAVMAATVVAAAVSYVVLRKIPPMLWVTLAVVLVFGGLTLITGQGMFFYMKPTIVMALFAVVLIGGLVLGRPLLKPLMSSAMELDEAGWRKLTLRFGLFFASIAILNEIIWRTQSTDFWVAFKAFGVIPLTMGFAISQMPLTRRYHLEPASLEASEAEGGDVTKG